MTVTITFPCEHPGCDRIFRRLYNMRVHLRKHTGEKPYQCPIKDCNKSFKWRSSLAHHKKLHQITVSNLFELGGVSSFSDQSSPCTKPSSPCLESWEQSKPSCSESLNVVDSAFFSPQELLDHSESDSQELDDHGTGIRVLDAVYPTPAAEEEMTHLVSTPVDSETLAFLDQGAWIEPVLNKTGDIVKVDPWSDIMSSSLNYF